MSGRTGLSSRPGAAVLLALVLAGCGTMEQVGAAQELADTVKSCGGYALVKANMRCTQFSGSVVPEDQRTVDAMVDKLLDDRWGEQCASRQTDTAALAKRVSETTVRTRVAAGMADIADRCGAIVIREAAAFPALAAEMTPG